MKKLISFFIVILIIAASVFGFLFSQKEHPPLAIEDKPKIKKAESVFAEFPLNTTMPVQLDLAESDTFNRLSILEKVEQIRDWLLYLVLTSKRLDAKKVAFSTYDMPPLRRGYTKTGADFQHGPIRYAFLGDKTAIALVPEKQSAEGRHDSLAEIADNHLLVQNETLSRLFLFEYCIELTDGYKALTGILTSENEDIDDEKINIDAVLFASQNPSAAVKYIGIVEKNRLYSSEYGWIKKTLYSKDDIVEFLASTNDLITIKITPEGLEAIGRKYKSRTYDQLTIEHIATLWQAYEEIENARENHNRRLTDLVNKWAHRALKEDLVEFDADLANEIIRLNEQGQYYINNSVISYKDRDFIQKLYKKRFDEYANIYDIFSEHYKSCKWQDILYALRADREKDVASFERVLNEFEDFQKKITPHQSSLLRNSIGFSLDSDYNFDILKQTFLDFLKKDKTIVSELLGKFRAEIMNGFEAHNADLILCLLQGLDDADDDTFYRHVQASVISPARYQIARYDGGIEGTEVGQILFVTDLLAKLLDFDFQGIFEAYFEGVNIEWTPSTYRTVPEMYMEQQKKLPGTRIWFGIKNESFAIDDDSDTIRFSRIAARVYALSRKIFGKDDETQPAYLATQFVDWFNNYYDKVGAVEPNYDRLNQIVKWSIVVDYVRNNYQDLIYDLAFLANEPVRRNLWFPEWVKTNTAFPGDIPWIGCFHPRGRYREDVETMPVFHVDWTDPPEDWCGGNYTSSEHFRVWSMNGGVSLPRTARAKGFYRPEMMREVPVCRRVNIAEDGLKITDTSVAFSKKPEYNYRKGYEIIDESSGRVKVRRSAEGVKQEKDGSWVSADQAVYQRGKTTEIKNESLSEVISRNPHRNRLVIDSEIAGKPSVKTTFTANSSVLKIRQKSEVVDIGNALGLKLTRSKPGDWTDILASDRRVGVIAKFDENGILVKPKHADHWIEFGMESKPLVDIPETWDSRVSTEKNVLDILLGGDPKPIHVKVLSEVEVAERANKFESFVIKEHISETMERTVEIRGPPSTPPPPKGPSITVGSPQGPFRGNHDSKLGLIVRRNKGERAPVDDIEDFKKLVGAVESFDLKQKLAALPPDYSGDIIIPLKKAAHKLDPEIPDKLIKARNNVFANNLRDQPDEFIASMRRTHRDYMKHINKAMEIGDMDMFDRLKTDYFQSPFEPSFNDLLKITHFEAKNYLPPEFLANTQKIIENVKRPNDLIKEISAKIRSLLESEGPKAAEEYYKASQIFMFKSAKNNTPFDIKLTLATKNQSPIIKAELHHPVENRPFVEGELEGVASYFIDQRLKMSAMDNITTTIDDPIVMEIKDPSKLVGRAISEADPDILTLGNAVEFKRVRVKKTSKDLDFNQLKEKSANEWVTTVSQNLSRTWRIQGGPPGVPPGEEGGNGDMDDGGPDTAGTGDDEKMLMITSAKLIGRNCYCDENCRKLMGLENSE